MRKTGLSILIIIFVLPFGIFAHPHVFITSKIEVAFNGKGLEGINVEWEFDAMFSSFIISEHDKNRSGKFEPQEVSAIEQGAFSNLANHNYFSYLIIQNEQHRVTEVKNFNASISGNAIVYNFFIPFELPFEVMGSALKIGFFDETIFCDVSFADKNPYTISAPVGVSAVAEIVTNPDFWSIDRAPQELKITVRRI